MKLALVHSSWPDEAPGGAELHVAELAAGLAARGHEVVVIAGEHDPAQPDGAWRGPEARDGFELWRLASGGRHGRNLGAADPAAGHAIRQLVARLQPELVHAHHVHRFGAAALLEVHDRGTPLALSVHDHWPSCLLGQLVDRDLRPCPGPAPARCAACLAGPRLRPAVRGIAPLALRIVPPLRRPFEERQRTMSALLRAADALIAPSHYFARRLAALGWPQPRVIPLARPALTPAPRPPRAAGSPLRVGFVGTLIPSKGAHVLVEAVRGLPAGAIALELHGPAPAFHGETGYAERLRERLGPRAAALRGAFAAGELSSRLAALDVLVIPSLWEENAPRVLAEAHAAGVVPVVSGHGRLAEAVRDGVDGLHFLPGDALALRRVLAALASEPERVARLAAAAPPPASFEQMLASLEAAYDDARGRHRSRTGRVGVVVLDRGAPELSARAAASALASDASPRVLVVHNGPVAEGPLPAGAERLRLDRNGGYAAGMNAGIAALHRAGCDRALLLNNDAWLEPGALRALAEAVDDPGVGAAGPVVLRAGDGRIESAGVGLGPALLRPRLRRHGAPAAAPGPGSEAVEALSGVALMVSMAALEATGPLREHYFHGFEDVDLGCRLRCAGLGLSLVGRGRVRHLGSASLGTDSPLRLYYSARNHVLAAEALRPLPWALARGRRLALLVLAVSHALAQHEVPRLRGLAAALRGVRAGWRGVTGEA
jgi:glycosyltransferase involved in cell wall biosynthesis/GT2 family glycosyltransferase